MSTATAANESECSRCSESESATIAGQQLLEVGAPETPAPAAALELTIGPAETQRGADTKEHESADAEAEAEAEGAAAVEEDAGVADEGAVVVVDAVAAPSGATTAAAAALLVSPGDRVSSRGDRLRLYSISASNLLNDAYASRANQITRTGAVACFLLSPHSTLLDRSLVYFTRCTAH